MRLAVDASVSLKWVLEDEPGASEAISLLTDGARGAVELVAPDLWLSEVANGVRVAVARRRLTREQGETAVGLLRFTRISLLPFPDLARRAFEIANDLNLPIYDSAYVALAADLGVELYTGDRPFFNRTKGAFPFVHWFTDYRAVR